ncbi:MAG: beta strand repeat-containing protein, partial [Verrucomicrobiota bacterium]
MKNKLFTRLVLSSMALGLAVNQGMANPLGGSVAAGSATISGEGTAVTTILQTSDRAIINWQDFSIGLGDITRFIQPGADAAVLNRVLSGSPSQLLGTLQANGQVYVINPSGILIGANAQINAGTFVGSTLDVANSAFLSGGNMQFLGSTTAGVENLGTINALGGDIFLFGHTVKNSGTLNAGGTVGLAAGMSIELRQAGNERIGVVLGNTVATAETGVDNQGLVQATSVEINAAGGNIYAVAINNGGVVRAQPTLVMEGGKLVLKSEGGLVVNSGTLDASNDGGKGGDITVVGEKIALTGAAKLDASGKTGGGNILVGGDYQGNNPLVPNALITYAGPQTSVKADALESGNGGKVILWSDEATGFEGTISARGGAAGGNGGFAEVSSSGFLGFGGSADLRAPQGSTGTLLLDPTDITISTAADSSITFSANQFSGTAGTANLNTTTLANQLNLSSVEVTTASGFGGNGDITVMNGFNWNSANGLTLNATRDITVNAAVAINNNGSGGVTFVAGRNVTLSGAIALNGGAFTAGVPGGTALGGDFVSTASGVIATTGGAVNINAANVTVGGVITTAGAIDIQGNTSLTLTAGIDSNNANIRFRNNVTVGGNISISSGSGAGNIVFNGNLNDDAGNRTLNIDAGTGTVTFQNIGNSDALGTVAVNSSSGITFAGTTYTTPTQSYTAGGGTFALTAGAATTFTATSLTLANGGMTLSDGSDLVISSTGGTISISSIQGTSDEDVNINAGTGTVSLGAVGNGTGINQVSVTANVITLNGAIVTSNGDNAGDVTMTGAVTLGGAASINTADGNASILFTSTVDDDAAGGSNNSLSVNSGTGNVTFTGQVGSILAPGSLTVANANNVNFNNTVVVSGALTQTTGTGPTTFNNTVSAGSVNITTTTDINVMSSLTATGGGNIRFAADSIDLFNTVSGTGTITFTDFNNDATIGVDGGVGTLQITNGELNFLADGFSRIIFGSATLNAAIDTGGAYNWLDSVEFNAGGAAGTVLVLNAIDTSTTAGNSVTINSGSATRLGANITTSGGSITISGRLNIDGARTLDTTDGNIVPAAAVTINNAIESFNGANTDTLFIDADLGAANGGADDAAVTLGGTYGASTTLGTLQIEGDTVSLNNVRVDNNPINITASTVINLGGTSYTTTTAGAINFTGAVELTASAGTIAVATAGGANITFSSVIEDTSSNNTLSLTAGAGNVNLQGNAGSTRNLAGLTVVSAAVANLEDVTVTGNIAVTAGTINLNDNVYTSTTGAITFTGPVVLNAGGAVVGITLNGGEEADDLLFTSTINDVTANNGLLINVAGSGDATFQAAIGGTAGQELAQFIVNDADVVDLDSTVETIDGGAIRIGANGTPVTQLDLSATLFSHNSSG